VVDKCDLVFAARARMIRQPTATYGLATTYNRYPALLKETLERPAELVLRLSGRGGIRVYRIGDGSQSLSLGLVVRLFE
jgi:hypothetical protein